MPLRGVILLLAAVIVMVSCPFDGGVKCERVTSSRADNEYLLTSERKDLWTNPDARQTKDIVHVEFICLSPDSTWKSNPDADRRKVAQPIDLSTSAPHAANTESSEP